MTAAADPPRGAPPARRRRLLGAALLLAGLAITLYFGGRALRSFRQFRYIQSQGLDRGVASVDAIRPWMTIRFIAVAYAVPEEYIYSQLGIPFDRRNAHQTLGELNDTYRLGPAPASTDPLILDTARAAISDYRANPVAPGLRDIRPWMSVRYIANSTGIPAAYIFKQLGMALAGNEDKPLDLLSDEQRYPGGARALIAAVDGAIATYRGQ